MAGDLPLLTVADAQAWHDWLAVHHAQPGGVWLVLAKKGLAGPTTLTYDEALEEALGHGWVDGQVKPGDGGTFRRRFTPRRKGSAWSMRNVAIIARLAAEGRMHEAGIAAVRRAREDGTWDAAYAGQATIQVPDDLESALAREPSARIAFDRLNGANRYAVLYRVATARTAATRARRIEQLSAMLARGETIHPQRPRR